MRYNGGSAGEVSREGLIGDAVHGVARVGLHARPHVAIQRRGVVDVVDVARSGAGLRLHPAVHAGFSGGEGLVAVGARQQRRLVGRRRAEVVLLRDRRRRLQVRTLASKIQVPGIICKEDGVHEGWLQEGRLRTYLCA